MTFCTLWRESANPYYICNAFYSICFYRDALEESSGDSYSEKFIASGTDFFALYGIDCNLDFSNVPWDQEVYDEIKEDIEISVIE